MRALGLTFRIGILQNGPTYPRIFSRRKYTLNPMRTTHADATATVSGIQFSKSKFKMSGWQIHSYGELDELQFSERLRIPQIRCARECLVRVQATTVNPIDVAMLGGYGSTMLKTLRCDYSDIEFPLTLGREFCGVLQQRGMGNNSKMSAGDRVWGVVPVQRAAGAHAEYVTVPDYCLGPAPANLSNEEAASVLYAGLTAWSGLYISGHLGGLCGAFSCTGGGAGKRVLVLGGSGSVGSLAIQMLKSQNVQVVATCSEDAVCMVQALGADKVLDYSKSEEFQEELRLYAPFDIVLDCAGQGAQGAERLGVPFKQYITFNSPLLRNIDSSGLALGALKNAADLLQANVKTFQNIPGACLKWGFFVPAPQGIEFIKNLVERKRLLPAIDSSYAFNQLPEAFKRVQDGHLRGKVVVKVC